MAFRNNGLIRRGLLTLTMLLAPLQIYTLPVGEIYPSLVLLLSLSLFIFYDVWTPLRTSTALKCLAALILAQAVSLLWAVNVRDGIREIIYTLPFFFIFAACMHEAKRDPRFVIGLIVAYSVCALVQSGLVIGFRLEPAVKISYLQSRAAGIFANPSTLNGLFDVARNNALDPEKSGGFEVNANFGGVWIGMVGILTVGIAVGLRRPLLACVGVVHLCAVAFTGSKASLMLAVMLLFVMSMLAYTSRKISASRLALVFFMLAGVVVVGVAGSSFLSSTRFGQDSSDTFGSRQLIWAHAASEFIRSPFLGQGFGGWAESFKSYAWQNKILELPPHDTFIQLWSQSGIPAVVCGAAFAVTFATEMVGFMRCGPKSAAWIGAGMLCGFLFIFIQGLGENWGLLGTLRVSPMLAACLGVARVIAFRIRKADQDESTRSGAGRLRNA
ncbi:O-Antigen ligase [Caballeronia catudaia]|uniref:O-Antigen ligase n=1 Tax=Caballeronia catudaia TaxID=1777136 RepID=A0A158CAH0_9BURK|nr:O-antigen ligase family protein [Caballeronia catudaia]SAK79272.1 O-Antigen ligase [Caballeronia catudaia]